MVQPCIVCSVCMWVGGGGAGAVMLLVSVLGSTASLTAQ